jgi:starch synthase
MEIIHVAAECYPVAKVGGLGDVVGALPKYQQKLGHVAKVVLPMYRTKFLYENQWETVHKGVINVSWQQLEYTVIKEATNKLGFDLYLIDINGVLDREKVYGYSDDAERFIAFQVAFAHWVCQWNHLPDVVHVHDYHAGFIPFIMKHCDYYNKLKNIPSVLTIHNAQYQGWLGLNKSNLLPKYESSASGLLEWEGAINPLACAIRCAWRVNAVSHSYMQELLQKANGLEKLFEYEKGKCLGIVNGIDNEVWNPAADEYLSFKYNTETVDLGKQKNKEKLCEQFGLYADKPLFTFIGRLVGEKAADILPEAIATFLHNNNGQANCIILGSGDTAVENQLVSLKNVFPKNFNCYIGYSEGLSHELYAGADFLLMPSRVEPCGLNQLYALRYGTMPLVRSTGGLIDTVKDIGEENGYGIRFNNATVDDVNIAVQRACHIYYNEPAALTGWRKQMMNINYSWDAAAENYIQVYKSLGA